LELGHEVYIVPLLGRLAPFERVPEVLREKIFYAPQRFSLRIILLTILWSIKGNLIRYLKKSRQYMGIYHSLLFLEVVERLKRLGVERIHVHFASNAAIKATVLSDFLRIPFSCTGHGSELLLYPDKHLPEVIEKANPFITISNYNRAFLVKRYGIPEEKIRVNYCGVDLRRFNPGIRKKKAFTYIVSVTWMRPEKGIKYLLEACRILREKGLNFRCTIAGGGNDIDDIKRVVASLDLAEMINLPGSLLPKEVMELYSKADIFVLPSLSEGIPVVIMEAMAMQLPVIATRITGIPEIVEDRVNGFLVEPESPELLAEKIESLIHNPSLREEMGRKGRAVIEERFNLDKNVRVLEGWLKES
ncbi:MAG: glycosyltransferase family 4 protein, partial [Thermodesulfobacteriota bacterium]